LTLPSFIIILLFLLDFQHRIYGIVDFELAFSGNRAGMILSRWDRAAVDAARASLLLDFLFIPAYGVAFAGITSLLTRNRPASWQHTGRLLIGGVIAAALLDVLENIMLLYQLQGDVVRHIPPLIAGISASIKFLLLGITVIFWIVAGLSRILQKDGASSDIEA
jgi:hypothetical protein